MSEVSRVAPEGETPVNPYSLLEAVNNSSDTAHTAWLIFLAIMTYFMIAVAGVTHRDLLLETPVALPILQVAIPVTQFFQFAPVVLVMLHIGLLSQLVLLARKILEFDHAIRLLETSERRTHPLRLELNNFFFVQAVAGPHRSAVMSVFLHGMSWLTLVILPVILILYIQVVFLPYHDLTITWTHRIALLVDIALLLLIGVFLMRLETSFVQAFVRTTAANPFSFVATVVVLGFAAMFSLFAATIPGERLDRVTTRLFGAPSHLADRDMRYGSGLLHTVFNYQGNGALFGILPRWLVVTDTDLVPDKDLGSDEPSIKLRGRDLRFARLDRSDLHQADLTGAILDDASLSGADLSKVRMSCADTNELRLSADRQLAKCTSARATNFVRARLADANLGGADLRGARFDEARMESVELTDALLVGANFFRAFLDKADITGGVQAQGANFLLASLQGADLTGAQLQYATLSNASLQGAVLSLAQLQSAVLRDADLEAASLHLARLEGADLSGARISGADFRGALVWMTKPPMPDQGGLADFSEVVMKPLDEAGVGMLSQVVDRIDEPRQRSDIAEALRPIAAIAESRSWAASAEQQRWQALVTGSQAALSESYRSRLTDYLGGTVCSRKWSNGAGATGVMRRALGQTFRGDVVALNDKLRSEACPASKSVSAKVLKEFSSYADLARSN